MTDTSKTTVFASKGRARLFGKEKRAGNTLAVVLLFLPPSLLLFTLFVALPIGEAAWYSLFNWNGYGAPQDFVGLRNFALLFQDEAFRIALINNLLVVASALIIQLPLALLLAILIADRIPGSTIFRLIFFLPYILAEIAAGLIWRFVYDGEYGLLAQIFNAFGAEPPYVLSDPSTAMAAVLVVMVWKYFGFYMMLYIAGLQQIDKSLYEAARIDGATRWQIFRKITFPLLGSTTRLAVFFVILSSIQKFDLIMPLTKGGPMDSTQTMVTYLYTYGVTRMDIGFGSAVGVVLFLICVVFAFTYKRTLMRND
uniref:Sugar ABC transporter permease n=1 Tax=Rhizobium leguminosarum TaxID=384 RepID=A0A154IN43_RHILE|nr:sugar ABC transporter permease [Rhizobium leguminosarum]KZB02025.1 sugar ABC transporter permease [Rhizobium leguminosarum]